ncbi:SPX domain-containing protein 4 [Capsicum chinense]|nr:SPX domain-containing protein 4 [Capsicum chinense]
MITSADLIFSKASEKGLGNPPPPAPLPVPAELQDWFIRILNEELEKFNDFYADKEEDFIIRFLELKERIEHVKEKSGQDGVLATDNEFSEEMMSIRKDFVSIHGEMVLLKNYSSLNFAGLVKILKKYDKQTGGLLRLPFTQVALHQPIFTTETLMRLVRECEDNHEVLFPVEAEVVELAALAASLRGGGLPKPYKETTRLINYQCGLTHTPKASLRGGGLPKPYKESTHLINYQCGTFFSLSSNIPSRPNLNWAWKISPESQSGGPTLGEMSLALIPCPSRPNLNWAWKISPESQSGGPTLGEMSLALIPCPSRPNLNWAWKISPESQSGGPTLGEMSLALIPCPSRPNLNWAWKISPESQSGGPTLDMPAVVQLEKYAKYALAYQLLKIFLTGRLDDYLNFQEASSELLKTYDLGMMEAGQIPYSTIKDTLKIDDIEVESWVFKAISAELLVCKIDQMNQVIIVSQCTERVFGPNQWQLLRAKLAIWRVYALRSSLVTTKGFCGVASTPPFLTRRPRFKPEYGVTFGRGVLHSHRGTSRQEFGLVRLQCE